ncbi:MAG: nucleotide excision repair endonuclease [Verrucomicrobiota bacterium]|nr:nucleotide excision repair endonuclease [Limisphaera sp.]MDW8381589.1 nucleotide excision repair endonuclease [Verrucomicrobiota bacterium]
MSVEQQLTFGWVTAARPLRVVITLEKLRAAPVAPGVYWFAGAHPSGVGGRVLYVGQSSNLRQRLAAYRNLRPEQAPEFLRRVLRLVREVRWQRCEDLHAARSLEAELLVRYRPPGNRLGTSPESRGYVGFQTVKGWLIAARRARPEAGGEWFGPFAGIDSFHALLRCIWRVHHLTRGRPLPAGWCQDTGPEQACYPLTGGGGAPEEIEPWPSLLREYWGGETDRLIRWLRASANPTSWPEPWAMRLYERDVEQVELFYHRIARPWRQLRARFGVRHPCLTASQVEQLLALKRATQASRKALSHP